MHLIKDTVSFEKYTCNLLWANILQAVKKKNVKDYIIHKVNRFKINDFLNLLINKLQTILCFGGRSFQDKSTKMGHGTCLYPFSSSLFPNFLLISQSHGCNTTLLFTTSVSHRWRWIKVRLCQEYHHDSACFAGCCSSEIWHPP